MASLVLAVCLFCVILIKRNITLEFSLKVVALVVLINTCFIANQILSERQEQTVGANILEAIAQAGIAQYVPMGQIFTKRQWQLFKAYQIKFTVRRTERLSLEKDLVSIDRGFSLLFWMTQMAILAYTVCTGIYMCYPDAIEKTCENFTP